ncbi:hypothetical protein GGP41_000810 [Bipolaris sorokiniana]|uniref:DUF676 domain-containing protein n=1 Tax=Cochliobolus sativus TaxID=45130 RepID=A0A8H5ZKV1_COCSA|nr:hypothetical protein GGP41_000810 [Bipolaris sorokiniana]
MARLSSKDECLRVLREAPTEVQSIEPASIVAIHGLGAHPDKSWCKNVGTAEAPQWRNWLIEDDMLPAVAPNARIMRYGYTSQWFDRIKMQLGMSIVAEQLLRALKQQRKNTPFRPLVFVAHCFGGLIVLKALLEAEQYLEAWPGLFSSTTGLIFFGTPFRSAEGMSQMEILDAARRKYHDNQVQPVALEVLRSGNAYIEDLVNRFLVTMRGRTNRTRVVCFFELELSNVGKVVDKQDPTRFIVSEHAGCLDLSESIYKVSVSRTHFDINKFGDVHEEDFETFSDLLWDIVEASPHLLWARSQGNYDVSPCYIKQGGPSALNVSKQNIEVDLRLSLDANSQALVSPVEDQDQLLSEQNDDGLYSQSVAEIACGCLPATEVYDTYWRKWQKNYLLIGEKFKISFLILTNGTLNSWPIILEVLPKMAVGHAHLCWMAS